MSLINFLIWLLSAAICALILTGGMHYSSPTLKLELSQVDAFAWALFALLVTHRKKTGRWLPDGARQAADTCLELLERHALKALGLGIAVHFSLFFWMSIWRFDSFNANAFDLGYVDQALWSTTRSGFLLSSISRGGSYLGEHFSPILGAVALIYRLWDSVYALFAFQCLLFSLSSLLVFKLARIRGLPKSASVVVALLYLVYQPTRAANSFDFREDDLFIPIFFSILIALESRRWFAFGVLALLSWAVKENAPLFTLMLGLWISLRKKNRKAAAGLFLAAVSLAAFAIINLKLTPYFAGPTGETMAARRLGRFGSSNAEILASLLMHPASFALDLLAPALRWKTVKYAFVVLTPFLAFASAAPQAFAIAAAGIAMNALIGATTLGFHYECALIPFLFYVLIAGIFNLRREGKDSAENLAVIALGFLLFFGRSAPESIRKYVPSEHHKMVKELVRAIPPDASVATQSALFPHLSHRKEIRLFSLPSETDYIVIDLSEQLPRYATPNLEQDAKALASLPYEKIVDQNGFQIWRKGASDALRIRK